MNAVQVFDAVMNPKVIVLAFLSSVACASPDDTDEGRQSGTVGDSGGGGADVDVPGTSGDASVVEPTVVEDASADRMVLTPEDPCGDVEGEGPIHPDQIERDSGTSSDPFALLRAASECLNLAQAQLCVWEVPSQTIGTCTGTTFDDIEQCAAAVLSQDPQTYCPDGYRAPLQDEACLPLFQREDCDLNPLGSPPPTCDPLECPEAPGIFKDVNHRCCAETRCGLLMPHGPGNGLLCTPIEETDYSNWIDAGTDWWKDGGGG